jgi:hypothetical protein
VCCLLIYIRVKSLRVIVHDRGASHVDTIKGEAGKRLSSHSESKDDESPLWVTCVTSLVTLPPC